MIDNTRASAAADSKLMVVAAGVGAVASIATAAGLALLAW
jgi:hypothetical protein